MPAGSVVTPLANPESVEISNDASVLTSFGFTVPFRFALVPVMGSAATVVTVGAAATALIGIKARNARPMKAARPGRRRLSASMTLRLRFLRFEGRVLFCFILG